LKYEWKKQEKQIYLPGRTPELLNIPSFKFFTLEGSGNPNGQEFGDAVGVLYSLAYGVKMSPKSNNAPTGYFDYTIYPLEGIWDLSEEAKKNHVFDKEQLVYKIMIRQPEFVTEAFAQFIIEHLKKKKPHPLLDKVLFEEIMDGRSVQMLHIGAFDNEKTSFDLMKEFCVNKGLVRKSMTHREIYLSDSRKTAPEKLKTVLRFKVE
jgi:hypothetical protein